MKQALGLVEIQGLSTAITVADTMVKAANVRILELENTRGLGYMTIKITGDVGAVNAAVNAGRQVGTANQKLVSWKVIPRPTDYVEHTFCNPDPPKPDAPDAPAQKKAVKKSEMEHGPEMRQTDAVMPPGAEAQQRAEAAEAKAAAAAENKKEAEAKAAFVEEPMDAMARSPQPVLSQPDSLKPALSPQDSPQPALSKPAPLKPAAAGEAPGPADFEAPSKQQGQTAPEGAKTAPAHKKSGTSKRKK